MAAKKKPNPFAKKGAQKATKKGAKKKGGFVPFGKGGKKKPAKKK